MQIIVMVALSFCYLFAIVQFLLGAHKDLSICFPRSPLDTGTKQRTRIPPEKRMGKKV